MSSTHDGRRFLLDGGLALSIVLATLTGVVAWYGYVELTFEANTDASPADHQGALTTSLVTAAILLVGSVAVRVFRGPVWLHLMTGVGVIVQLAIAAGEISGAMATPDPDLITPDDFSLLWSLQTACVLPTSWPLLAFVLAALVRSVAPPLRVPSSRAPR